MNNKEYSIDSISGEVISIEPRKTKKGGKAYYVVTVETVEGDNLKLYAWDGEHEGLKVGDFVQVGYQPGDWPKLKGYQITEAPPTHRQKTLDGRTMPKTAVSSYGGNQHNGETPLASSRQYLALKLAVELVKDEAVQVDDKLLRVRKSFPVMWELLAPPAISYPQTVGIRPAPIIQPVRLPLNNEPNHICRCHELGNPACCELCNKKGSD